MKATHRRKRRKSAYHKREKARDMAGRRTTAMFMILSSAVMIWFILLLMNHVSLPGMIDTPQKAVSTAPPGTPTPYVFEVKLSGKRAVQPERTVEPLVVETTANNTPRVLIYHTHATEAYTMTTQSAYEETTKWRTENPERNVVAVGSMLAEQLRSYGIHVLHDKTDHEPPKLSTAYSRSEITMKTFRALYPSIELYIDVHRDAYSKENGIRDVAIIDGVEAARLMFVVGTGEGATGTGFAEMPDYRSNLALANTLTESLEGVQQGLTRPVRIKTGRYNQHISNRCLLVEVGHNANTLEQALSAVPYLARAIAVYLNENGAATAATPLDGTIWVPMD